MNDHGHMPAFNDDEIDYDALDAAAAVAPDIDLFESCPIPTVDEMEQLLEQALQEVSHE